MDLIPDIAGGAVTADALLTRTAIAACLHRRGARFMLIARVNRKNMLREVRDHFSSQPPRKAGFMTRSPQPEHGRIERREIRISTDPVHRIVFPWVEQVFMIRRTVREYRCARNGKPATTGDPSAGTVLRHHQPHAGDRRRRGAPETQPRPLVMRARPPDPCRCRDMVRGRMPGAQRARSGEPQLPPPAGGRPHHRARQAGRADAQAAGPEPAHGARLAPAHPEHAATREARHLKPHRPGPGPRNLPGNAGRAVRHARCHAQGGRNRRQNTEPSQEQPDPMPDGHPARHRNRRIRSWRQRTPS